ncbi:MAG TPA: PQQ-binding-like beta-propeller repeat protein [Planctomycetota bacterium]|nr:PQQ-binding-like beta-propeller repeat protein [Planctomycetota bacterium]
MAGKPDYIGQLEACGWFAGWPKDAADKYRRRIGTALKKAAEPWQALALICGDAECIEGQGDFTAALKDIARQSCGMIKPAKIRESWDDDPVVFSFELGGRRFEARLPLEGDCLPAEFHELLARAVGDACKPLRLRGLTGGGQFFSYVLVAPEALKAAVKKKLIPAKCVEKELRARTPPKKAEDKSPKEDSRPVMERGLLTSCHATARRGGLDFPKGYQLPAGDPDRWAASTFEAAAAPAEPAAFEAMLTQPSARTPLALAWRKKISGKGDFVGLAQIDGGRLFVATDKADLEAWDLRTGEPLWKASRVRRGALFTVAAGMPLSSSITEKPRGELLSALDPATGKPLKAWRDHHFLGRHADGLVFQVSGQGAAGDGCEFRVLDAVTLEPVRSFAAALVYAYGSCCLAGDVLVAAESAGSRKSLVAISLTGGDEIARKVISAQGIFSEYPRHVHGDLVLTRFRDNDHPYLACRRATDLEEQWRLDASALDVVSARTHESGGKLLVSTSRSGVDLKGPAKLHCLDMRTGRILWCKGEDPNVFLPPGGALYWTHHPFSDLRKGFHRLTAMSLETGEPAWSCDVEGKEYFFIDACASGHLYCRTCDRAGPVETMCFRTSTETAALP